MATKVIKVADVKLKWKPAVVGDLVRKELVITVDGEETTIDLSPTASEYMIELRALQSCRYQTFNVDEEGNRVPSVSFSFRVGDLVSPEPDTELGFEIVAVRDVEIEVPDDEPLPVAAD